MKHSKETLFYEDNKCIVTQDKWNYIVREKPINKQHPYRNATYINDKNNLLWELCDCRHFFTKSSKEAIGIGRLLLRA